MAIPVDFQGDLFSTEHPLSLQQVNIHLWSDFVNLNYRAVLLRPEIIND